MIGHRFHDIFRSGGAAEGPSVLQPPAQRPRWILSTAPRSCLAGKTHLGLSLLEYAVITEDGGNGSLPKKKC